MKFTTFVATFCASILLCDCSAIATVQYTVTDLGTLGDSSSNGLGINASGQVTGYSGNGSYPAAFLYDGTLHDLGTLGGGGSYGYGINSSGSVTGDSWLIGSGVSHAFLYDGTMHDLGTLGGSFSFGRGINGASHVVGNSDIDFDGYVRHAFLYDGTMHDLGTLGGDNSQAYAINSSGRIAGTSNTSGVDGHAFLWTPTTPNGNTGSMVDLGTLGGTNSQGLGMNDASEVVGTAFLAGDTSAHAFLNNGSMNDLGTLGGNSSSANAINSSDQVVGTSDMLVGPPKPFLYTSGGGMVDLNSLINPLSGWSLENATAINDSGQIAGYGLIGGQEHAFLLTPVPEPSTMVLTALGALGLIAARRRVKPPMPSAGRYLKCPRPTPYRCPKNRVTESQADAFCAVFGG